MHAGFIFVVNDKSEYAIYSDKNNHCCFQQKKEHSTPQQSYLKIFIQKMIKYKPQVYMSNMLAVFIVYKFQFRCIDAYTKLMPILRMNFFFNFSHLSR